MKGLAWYSVIILAIGEVALFTDLFKEYTDKATIIWGIVLGIPMLYFFYQYLKNYKEK